MTLEQADFSPRFVPGDPTLPGQMHPESLKSGDEMQWMRFLLELTEHLQASKDIQSIGEFVLHYLINIIDAAFGDIKIIRGQGGDRHAEHLTNEISGDFVALCGETVIVELQAVLEQGVSYGEGLLWQVVETGTPLFVDDYANHPQAVERFRHSNVRQLGIFPIAAASGDVIGVLTLESHHLQALQEAPQYDVILAACRTLGAALERRQAEASLRRSEARYRAIVEDQTDLICRFLPDRTITFVNQPFCDFFQQTRADLIGQKFIPDPIQQSSEQVEEQIAALTTEHPVIIYEQQFAQSDGTVRWLQWLDRVILDEQGTFVELQAVGREITARKQAEIALKRSEERFRGLFHDAPIGMVLVDAEQHLVEVNQTFCQMLGYSAAELTQMQVADITHPKDFQHEQAELQRVATGQTTRYQVEKRYFKQDRDLLWTNLTSTIIHDANGASYSLGMVEDITERKQAREALQRANEDLEIRVDARTKALRQTNRQLLTEISERRRIEAALEQAHRQLSFHVENSPLAVIEWDNELRIQHWSQQAEQIFGWRAEDVLGRRPADWHFVHDEDVELLIQETIHLISGEAPRNVIQTRNYTQQGEIVHCEWYNSALLDEAGHLISILSLVDDVTDRKQAEIALRQQAERERLMGAIAQNIRQTLDLDKVLDTTVTYVRQMLQTDRVVIYRFEPDWSGIVVVESVGDEWVSMLGRSILDAYLVQEACIVPYMQGEIHAVEDIYTANLDNCYLEFLAQFQVRANLVVPILQGEQLWGLLVAHHCEGPRQWQSLEVDLLEQLATQVGIAIRQAELYRQVQHSQQRYAMAVSAGRVGVWDWNLETDDVYLDPMLRLMLGYVAEGTSTQMQGWGAWVHPEDQPGVEAALAEHLEGEAPHFEIEHRVLRQDGSICWVLARGTAVWDIQGRPHRMTGTNTDITGRKQAEEELQRQNLRSQLFAEITLKIRQSLQLEEILQTAVTEIRNLLQTDRVLVYRVRPQKRWQVVTEAIAPQVPTLIGQTFDFEGFLGDFYQRYCQGETRIIDDVEQADFHPQHAEWLKHLNVKSKLVVPILQRDTLWGMLIVHHCSHQRSWSSFEIDLLQQLAVQIGIAIAQAQLLEALRGSEEKFRTLVEQTNDWVWEIDLAQVFTYNNPKVYEILGYPPEEILGKSIFNFMRPKNVQQFAAVLNAFLQRCEPFTHLEKTLIHRDGHPIVLETSGSPIFDTRGKLQGYHCISRDITERKQAEREIRKALAKEKELNELKSRFVSMTSHEFRTPLSTILSSAELLECYSEGWTEIEKQEQLQMIQVAVQQMTHLLDDVLLLGKAEAGKIRVQPVLVDLETFCQMLIAEMQRNAGTQHQLLFLQKSECPPLVYQDEKLLRQILTNLLANAIKYSPEGGQIELELTCDAEQAIFRVQDEGIGIPESDLPRLFESFHRAMNVGRLPGTGLGLAIVKRCVDALGGKISVVSEESVGTVFVVTLPLNCQSPS